MFNFLYIQNLDLLVQIHMACYMLWCRWTSVAKVQGPSSPLLRPAHSSQSSLFLEPSRSYRQLTSAWFPTCKTRLQRRQEPLVGTLEVLLPPGGQRSRGNVKGRPWKLGGLWPTFRRKCLRNNQEKMSANWVAASAEAMIQWLQTNAKSKHSLLNEYCRLGPLRKGLLLNPHKGDSERTQAE